MAVLGLDGREVVGGTNEDAGTPVATAAEVPALGIVVWATLVMVARKREWTDAADTGKIESGSLADDQGWGRRKMWGYRRLGAQHAGELRVGMGCLSSTQPGSQGLFARTRLSVSDLGTGEAEKPKARLLPSRCSQSSEGKTSLAYSRIHSKYRVLWSVVRRRGVPNSA